MILNAITEKLKRQSKDDFKGRPSEAWLIVQALTYYLRYPLSYRDLEEMFRERGFQVDTSTINRWVHLPCASHRRHREAAAPVSAPALWFGPDRRDLHPGFAASGAICIAHQWLITISRHCRSAS